MKNVIITGAKGNLGTAAVTTFLRKDYKVIACISQRDGMLETKNPYLEAFPLDLTDGDVCRLFIGTVKEKYNVIDAAVLTVGAFTTGNIDTVTKDDFDKMFALNFMTAFNIVQPLLKQMKQQSTGGKIILVSSGPGMNGSESKNEVAYGFSKSLIFRLAELINAEGNENNISATVIVPGTIDTLQNRSAMPSADFSKWSKAEDIADTIESICSGKGSKDLIVKV
jgi:NAD(P)-dependent dehydrogenase (short-subunit alcohol dehydrogenase family)